MVTLQHKTSQELVTLTYDDYRILPDLKDYEPIKAEDMVEVYKSNGEGGYSSFLITDKKTGDKMHADDPELYPSVDPWDDKAFRLDYYITVLPTDEYLEMLKMEIDKELEKDEDWGIDTN